MRIIYNHLIPFPGFKACLLFGLLFVRKGSSLTQANLTHESIHECQALDFCHFKPLGYLLFYILYLLYWFRNLFLCPHNAYYFIPFEVEAYANQYNPSYPSTRKPKAWKRYVHHYKTD